MELKEIVAIAGVSGLHKIIGRTKSGLILESLNETKKRFPTGIQDKVSVLEDISMYTEDGDMHLSEVLVKINEKEQGGEKIPTSKDDAKTQRSFVHGAIKLDNERVYDSDIKKLLTWYHLLKELVDFSTLLKKPEDEQADDSAPAETAAETTEAAPEEKPKAKKAAAKKTAASEDKEVKEEAEEKPKKAAPKKAAAKKTAASEEKEAKPKAAAKKKKSE